MLLLDGVYVNNGGGKILLDYLVSQIEQAGIETFYLFDQRCQGHYSFVPEDRKIFVSANLIQRYRFYRGNAGRFSKILCFGNLPPPVHVRGAEVFVYFHNVSLLEQPANYSLKESYLKKLKALYIHIFNRSRYQYIVQTDFVESKISMKFKHNKSHVLPFFRNLNAGSMTGGVKTDDCFVYISNGNTHKNHTVLLDAWELLAERGVSPELHLTITENFVELCTRLATLQRRGLRIVNHGFTNPVELYSRAKYSIYPSLIESFGLGLVEAIYFGCEIIASDLQYVYEVCEPFMVFDPISADDLALKIEMVLSNPSRESVSKIIVNNEIAKLLDILRP